MKQMDKSEYDYLYDKLHKIAQDKMEYNNTIASVLNGFIDKLPVNAAQAMEIINKFNPEDFQQVLQFAQVANGGRPVK